MGIYADDLDDNDVERKAFDLCKADGVEDPEWMTYESDGGILMPYGPIWSRYIDAAVAALSQNSTPST